MPTAAWPVRGSHHFASAFMPAAGDASRRVGPLLASGCASPRTRASSILRTASASCWSLTPTSP
eukprot:1535332-Pyramimonas_sp.AAC.1